MSPPVCFHPSLLPSQSASIPFVFSEDAQVTTAVATGVRTALGYQPKSITVALPEGLNLEAVALGSALGAYRFDKYMSKPATALKQVAVLAASAPSAADKKAFARVSTLATAFVWRAISSTSHLTS